MQTHPDSLSPDAAPRVPRRAYRLVRLVGAIGTALSLALAVWFAREARRLDTARFFELGNAIGVDLERRVEAIEAMLRDVQRILNAKEVPDLLDWEEFMNQVSPQWNHPGVLAIGYATNTAVEPTLRTLDDWTWPDAPRPRAEFYRLPAELQTERSWRVWVWDVFSEKLLPPGDFASVVATTNASSRQTQQQRFQQPGTDLERTPPPFFMMQFQGRDQIGATESGDHHLLDAIYRDEIKIVGQQSLITRSDTNQLPGATMLAPTYHPRRSEFWRALLPTEELRTEAYWLRWNLNTGFVFAQLDLAAMLKEAQGPGASAIRVEIHSAYDDELTPGTIGPASWLNPDGQPLRASDPAFHPSYRYTHLWRMYGDRWTLFFHTTPLFDAQSTRYRAWWASGWGLLTTALVCWALALQVRGRWLEARRAASLQTARDALQAVHDERERLSHDLHDGAIQSLYAVQLGLTQSARDLSDLAPATSRLLGESRLSLDLVIAELRQFLGQLRAEARPGVPAEFLVVLKSIVARLRPASRAAIELDCDQAVATALSKGQALQLAAMVREALSNSLRHAEAKRINVRLLAVDGDAVLEIRDDGRGFEPLQISEGLGLKSLRRRAELLGTEFALESAPGQGTVVRVRLKPEHPIPKAVTQEGGAE